MVHSPLGRRPTVFLLDGTGRPERAMGHPSVKSGRNPRSKFGLRENNVSRVKTTIDMFISLMRLFWAYFGRSPIILPPENQLFSPLSERSTNKFDADGHFPSQSSQRLTTKYRETWKFVPRDWVAIPNVSFFRKKLNIFMIYLLSCYLVMRFKW